MSTTQIHVPDIGADSAEVIEILISEGDQIATEQSVIVLESDKASMEVPAPRTGKISKIHVRVGDQLSEGDLIADYETGSEEPTKTEVPENKSDNAVAPTPPVPPAPQRDGSRSQVAFKVPDIGSDSSEVIEINVAVGDQISEGDTICVAESDKASLEIPSEASGIVVSIAIAVGDQIGQGDDLISLEVASSAETPAPAIEVPAQISSKSVATSDPVPTKAEWVPKNFKVPDFGSESAEVIEVSVAVGDEIDEGDTICVAESDKASVEIPAEAAGKILAIHVVAGDQVSPGDELIQVEVQEQPAATAVSGSQLAPTEFPPQAVSLTAAQKTDVVAVRQPTGGPAYAGPAVRKLARELGVDLSAVPATGARGRVRKEDLHSYVKNALKSGTTPAVSAIPSAPVVDWSKYGSVRTEPMTKIHKFTAENMSRCWLNVPHVTQFDLADVSLFEDYRQQLKVEGEAKGIKMTPVAFLLKLAAKALREVPKFNSSIHEDGQNIVFRDYCHIGLAVDTPAGLMVPVVRDVDQKDIWQLAADIIELAGKAKDGKLKPNEMQGACFTVSSLGAIGGRGFTPIVPTPQVGILGVSNTSIQPVWDGQGFVPRKMMPLALSYDHRAVNGSDAGRFLTYLVAQFSSIENLL